MDDYWSALVEDRPCARCGANPALGYASVSFGGVELWYCHPDEGTSCYAGENDA